MKRNLELCSGLSVLTAACALLLAPLAASAEEATFEVELSGPEASGDSDGEGQATVTMDSEANRVDVRLSYSNIARPTAVYLRMGATGSQGNVVMPVVIERDEGGTLVASRQSAKPGVVDMILDSPDDYYLVVLNDDYPVGALLGQIQD